MVNDDPVGVVRGFSRLKEERKILSIRKKIRTIRESVEHDVIMPHDFADAGDVVFPE